MECAIDAEVQDGTFPQTSELGVVMEAAMMGNVKALKWMLSSKAFIWNQRGPCGRLPEQAALEAGHEEAYLMLLAVREQHELEKELAYRKRIGPKRI